MKNFPRFLIVLSIAIVFYYLYLHFVGGWFLRFSDGAKFADVARNLVSGEGYKSSFTFFNSNLLTGNEKGLFSANNIPTIMPLSIAAAFKIFGVGDKAVLLTSGFYYILLVLAVYFLAKKIYGNLVGIVSAISVAANIDFLNYATSGASEVVFSLLGVISAYFLFVKTKFGSLMFLVSLGLLYLARPQGALFILVLIFCYLIYRYPIKKGILIFSLAIAVVFSLDWFVLYPLSFRFPVYPITIRGIQAIFQYSPLESISDALRGESAGVVSVGEVVKKVAYNLYNFYKLLPQIASPYMWTFFVLSAFIWQKNKKEESTFKVLSFGLVGSAFLLSAITIPFFRYLHPVVPFTYIVASATLVWFVRKIFTSNHAINMAAISLIIFFVVGQTLGLIFLDSRFVKNTHNSDKAPVYVQLASFLKDNSDKDSLIVTNLDTWGSWYGERKTVWFPLRPSQLVNKSGIIPFTSIYLTDYLIDDENYYMGPEWRTIFDNPKDPKKWNCAGCEIFAKEYHLESEYRINAIDDYENVPSKAVLFVKN